MSRVRVSADSTDVSFERAAHEASPVRCVLVTELCVLRTFGGVDFSLIFICAQSVSE
eukprot:COSAG02_NODE_39912_length_411_cov_0.823718_2_plen_56_part_01